MGFKISKTSTHCFTPPFHHITTHPFIFFFTQTSPANQASITQNSFKNLSTKTMAPRTKRSRASFARTVPSNSQIRQWLHDETTVTRFQAMNESKLFEGAFMKFPDFNGYAI